MAATASTTLVDGRYTSYRRTWRIGISAVPGAS